MMKYCGGKPVVHCRIPVLASIMWVVGIAVLGLWCILKNGNILLLSHYCYFDLTLGGEHSGGHLWKTKSHPKITIINPRGNL